MTKRYRPEGGAEELEAFHEVSDELGKAIDRFGQLDECIRPFLVEPRRPRGNREWAHLKDSRRLGERPTANGAELEDGQSRRRRVVGSSVRLDLLHASILDADLLAQQLDLLSKPVLFGLLSKLGLMLSEAQPCVSAKEVLAREMT
jgi:hypothetical protein